MNKVDGSPNMQDQFSGYTQQFGLDTGPVSTDPYYKDAYFEQERNKIFGRAWLMVGRVEELPDAHCFIVRNIEIANTSVLVTRNKSGKILAFHNVCSHRGNQVVFDESGQKGRMVCRYHNWTYASDGDLINVPDESNFFSVDKAQCGLTKIACDIWNGWVFVNFQSKPEVTLAEYLGAFGEAFSNISLPNTDDCIVIEARLNANWKVIADAFAESYHIPAIHPKTIGTTFSSKNNPYSHPIHVEQWGSHKQVSTYGNPEYKPSSIERVERLAFKTQDMGNVLSAAQGREIKEFLDHPAVNPSKSLSWAVDVTWVFPNFHIDLSPGGFWTHQFWPLGANKTRWEARFYLPKAKTVRERFHQEHYASRLMEIMVEDLTNTERTQKGIESGAKPFMHLQDGEVMIRHHLSTVDKWIKAESVKDALK